MSARVPAALAPCAGFREPTSPSEVIPHHQLPESRQEPGFQHLPEHAQGDRNADTTGTGVGAARTGGSGAASPPEADRLPPLPGPLRSGCGRCGGGRCVGRDGGARTGGLAGGGPRPCVGSGAAAERRRRWRREPRPRDKREGAGRRAARVAALGGAWPGRREGAKEPPPAGIPGRRQ